MYREFIIAIFVVFVFLSISYASSNMFECRDKCSQDYSSSSEVQGCKTGCAWQYHPNIKGLQDCVDWCGKQYRNKGDKVVMACAAGCSK